MLFLMLVALAVAVAGATAYLMSWPLVATQLRDRHPAQRPLVGVTPFSPGGFVWFLRFAWRRLGDKDLSFLAFPASVAAWGIAVGSALTILTYLLRKSGIVV
ncbi:hypothetical protein [Tahibacter amnicola]|uniref:Transmembrane protein n=1 Tax=Tahibacter amnicola TaxID=2976241 RepID=A0ABY6BBB0_9GAMM|nr:hypothetical protein [Tahibacter amnicola]UXI66984.1 hypothetical protein N4264_19850 [Tahibacter amnicola]